MVRPGGLTEDEPRGVGAVELNQGDDKSGRIARADVAAVCVEAAAAAPDAAVHNATFECYWKDTAKSLNEVGLSNMMNASSDGGGDVAYAYPFTPHHTTPHILFQLRHCFMPLATAV